MTGHDERGDVLMSCLPCEHDVRVMRDTRSERKPHPACDRCMAGMDERLASWRAAGSVIGEA